MKKILFTFICAFIALGWVGCKSTSGNGLHEVYYVYIDSTLTACGMDSFLIKSPWVQEHIHDFIDYMDTSIIYYDCIAKYEIRHFMDKDSNDFFIDNVGYGWDPGRLFDCEGNIIEEKEPWELLLNDRDILVRPRRVVNIRIGTLMRI